MMSQMFLKSFPKHFGLILPDTLAAGYPIINYLKPLYHVIVLALLKQCIGQCSQGILCCGHSAQLTLPDISRMSVTSTSPR